MKKTTPLYINNLSVAIALLISGANASAGQSSQLSPSSASFVQGSILVMPRAGMSNEALSNVLKSQGGGTAKRVGKSELRIVTV